MANNGCMVACLLYISILSLGTQLNAMSEPMPKNGYDGGVCVISMASSDRKVALKENKENGKAADNIAAQISAIDKKYAELDAFERQHKVDLKKDLDTFNKDVEVLQKDLKSHFDDRRKSRRFYTALSVVGLLSGSVTLAFVLARSLTGSSSNAPVCLMPSSHNVSQSCWAFQVLPCANATRANYAIQCPMSTVTDAASLINTVDTIVHERCGGSSSACLRLADCQESVCGNFKVNRANAAKFQNNARLNRIIMKARNKHKKRS